MARVSLHVRGLCIKNGNEYYELDYRIFTARAASTVTTVRERIASIIMSALASLDRGKVSAGLRAVAPVKARKR